MISSSERLFVWVLVGSLAVVVAVAWWVPDPVDWSDSFAADDARPYASEVVRAALPDLFSERAVQTVEQPLFVQLRDTATTGGAYIFVTDRFAPRENATTRLLDYVARGNTVFVAAHRFGGAWADTLGLPARPRRPALPGVGSSGDSVRLQLQTTVVNQGRGVRVRRGTAAYVFDSLRTGSYTVLGTVETGDATAPTFVRRDFGEGTLLLSSTPRAFTNVHAVDERTASYIWGVFSHIPETADPVWWDAYHKPGRPEAETPLRFVLSTPPLRTAYVLLIVGALLFLVVKGRRRQRVIPVMEGPTNDTTAFVSRLGRLAHRRGDADTVARRRIAYLKTSLKERLNVREEPGQPGWVQQVAARSGVPPEDVEALANVVTAVQNAESVSEELLETLDRRIQAFREARSR